MALTTPNPEKLREIFFRLGFVTASPLMTPVLQCAYKAAQVSDTTGLLQGETGTGKQVLARAIHSLDQKRCRFGFVTIHCSTVTESLAESELFALRRIRGFCPLDSEISICSGTYGSRTPKKQPKRH